MELTHEQAVEVVRAVKEKMLATYNSFSEFKKGYVSAALWCETKEIAPWQLREDVMFNGMKIDSAEFKTGVLAFCNDQIHAKNLEH